MLAIGVAAIVAVGVMVGGGLLRRDGTSADNTDATGASNGAAPARTPEETQRLVAEAQRRIDHLAVAVLVYYRVFGAHPPSSSPDRTMVAGQPDSYPPLRSSQSGGAAYLFHHGEGDDQPSGGKFLAYFLMGPSLNGWHRPKDRENTADPAYSLRGLTGEWDPPAEVAELLLASPQAGGDNGRYPFPCFGDGIPAADGSQGLIIYMRERVYSSSSSPADRWQLESLRGAFARDCAEDAGNVDGHILKILAQCPEGLAFVLLSPGPDGKFGYRVTAEDGSSRADLAHGTTDDLANFQLK
jgi:hypothetical protein